MILISILALFIILLRAFEPLAFFAIAIVAIKAYREWMRRYYVGVKPTLAQRLKQAYAAFSHPHGS